MFLTSSFISGRLEWSFVIFAKLTVYYLQNNSTNNFIFLLLKDVSKCDIKIVHTLDCAYA